MTKNEVELDSANFSAQTAQGLTLVDFWAPWCGPCLAQAPVLESLAAKMAGRMTVGKCDVDENPELAGRFRISGIPTLVLIKDGREVERVVGMQSEARLASLVQKHL